MKCQPKKAFLLKMSQTRKTGLQASYDFTRYLYLTTLLLFCSFKGSLKQQMDRVMFNASSTFPMGQIEWM